MYNPDEDTSSDEDEPTVDMVSSDDAWMFPIGGSVMLVGLYVLFKYLNKDYLNYLFTAYFGIIGVFAVSNVLPPTQQHWRRVWCCVFGTEC